MFIPLNNYFLKNADLRQVSLAKYWKMKSEQMFQRKRKKIPQLIFLNKCQFYKGRRGILIPDYYDLNEKRVSGKI